MKTIRLALLLWLCAIGLAAAEIPKAELRLTASNTAKWPAQYWISLTVPQDHHAYLDAGDQNIYIPVAFNADNGLAGAGLALTKLEKPRGVYDDLVKATVLRGLGGFSVSLSPQSSATVSASTVPLAVKYQLCNDITHVCFRPQTVQLDLPLPAVAATAEQAPPQSVTERLLALFNSQQDNGWAMFGLMLAAGLLSVATPCVYPMLPITSMFIVGRGQGVASREKQHALVYLIGIIGTYAVLGLLAGLTGGAFNAFMQSAWINLAFAGFFAFFALALLGFYELSFMQGEVYALDQRTSRVGGLLGTWMMGSVAGLVISPCVGPIVFALLLQVADRMAEQAAALAALGQQLDDWRRLGIAASGGVMMAGFGVGVGLPFFIVGVVKFKKLPKAGYWMNKIKYAFGIAILYFAFGYFEKGMGVLGVTQIASVSLAVGMSAIWMAVVYCNVLSLLPADAAPKQKMHQYCGLMSLIVGIWLVVAGLDQVPVIKNAQASGVPAPAAVATQAGIVWHRSFAEAQQLAQQTGKPIFIDFYADWCANCIAFKHETEQNSALNDALRHRAIAVKLVDKEPDFEKFRNLPEHRPLKIGLPYFAILSPDGKLTWSGTDYQATQKMVAVLTQGSS